MSSRVLKIILAASLLTALANQQSFAGAITCGGPDTEMTVASAESCTFGDGNGPNNTAEAAVIWGGVAANWDKSEISGVADGVSTNQSNGFLTIGLTSGSWGNFPVAGTWTLSAGFWINHTDAVLKAHIGHGQFSPNWWGFELTPNLYSGTFSNNDLEGSGNSRGLSNFFLFGKLGDGPGCQLNDPDCEEPFPPVPEPGVLSLLGMGLLGLGLSRRRLKLKA